MFKMSIVFGAGEEKDFVDPNQRDSTRIEEYIVKSDVNQSNKVVISFNNRKLHVEFKDGVFEYFIDYQKERVGGDKIAIERGDELSRANAIGDALTKMVLEFFMINPKEIPNKPGFGGRAILTNLSWLFGTTGYVGASIQMVNLLYLGFFALGAIRKPSEWMEILRNTWSTTSNISDSITTAADNTAKIAAAVSGFILKLLNKAAEFKYLDFLGGIYGRRYQIVLGTLVTYVLWIITKKTYAYGGL
jgi:hypothetical protein